MIAKRSTKARAASSRENRAGSQRQISLLFDVFVLNQRLRTLLSLALAGTGMRPDEYAVYSLLFEQGPLTATAMARQMGMPLTTVLDYVRAMQARGHAIRSPHSLDGRAHHIRITPAGLIAFRKANAAWNAGIGRLEPSLAMPVKEVRRALHAMDDAAALVLRELVVGSVRKAS